MLALWKILSRVQKSSCSLLAAEAFAAYHINTNTTNSSAPLRSPAEACQSASEDAGKPLQKLHAATSPSPAASPTPLHKSGDPQSSSQRPQPPTEAFATRKREKIQSLRTSDWSFYSAWNWDFGKDPSWYMIKTRTCALVNELPSEYA